MKKGRIKGLISLLMVLLLTAALAMTLSACGDKDKAADAGDAAAGTEEAADSGDGSGDEEASDNAAKVVKTIDGIDEDCEPDLPLQIESVTLFEDGSVRIIPTEDLKKNAESNKELRDDAMYPFADSGKARDIWLVSFGNGGYRTIIALMEDGSLSALSAKELIEDRIAVVMDNVSGRDGFVSVEQTKDEDAFGVIGKTEDGEEVELDFSLNF